MTINSSLMSELSGLSASIGQKPTIVAQVTQLVRELIIDGRLRPGERIVESKIARELKVGQPTVREALKTLEGEGLVTYSPNRGCSVTELTETQIAQITRLRTTLELLAVELAVENRSKWDPQVVREALNEMKDAAQQGDVSRYYESDLKFHQKLWQLSENPYLVKALSQVALPLFCFVIRKHFQENPIDLNRNAREHEEIAEAVLSSEPAQVKEDVNSILLGFSKLYLSLTKHLPS